MAAGEPKGNRERGVQPLDEILKSHGLANTDLVKNSFEQLTHRMVTKGRRGRVLSLNVQMKILRALNRSQKERVYTLSELFDYGTER